MKLKGSKGRNGAPRVVVDWDQEAKVEAYALIKNDKVKAKAAFAQIAAKYNYVLGSSYANWPHTHVDRFKKEFERKCFPTAEEIAKGATVDKELMALLRKYDLVDDDPTETPDASTVETIDAAQEIADGESGDDESDEGSDAEGSEEDEDSQAIDDNEFADAIDDSEED